MKNNNKKKIISAVAVTAVLTSVVNYSLSGFLHGSVINAGSVYNADVNGDGKVNVMDLNIVKNIVLNVGSETGTPSQNITDEGDTPLTILCWNCNDSVPMVDTFCKVTGTDPSRIVIKSFDCMGGSAPEYINQYLWNSSNDADIIFMESDWAQNFLNDDTVTIPLSELGYADSDFENLYDYIVDTGRATKDGKLKAVSWNSAAGGYCYRTDLAEQYLGVTSPDEMQAKINDWDKFLRTAWELKKAGGPAISASLGGVMTAHNCTGKWVDKEKLLIDSYHTDFAEMAKKMWENGYVTKVFQWSDEWKPLGQTDKVMGFFVSTWGFGDTILTGAAGGEGGATYGKWNVCVGPSAFYWGGTWMAPAARTDNKALARQFIDFFTVNEETAVYYGEKYGEFMSNRNVNRKIVSRGYTGAGVLGGQNQFEVLDKAAEAIDVKGKISPYDSGIENEYSNAVYLYCEGTFFNLEETMDYFRDSTGEKYGNYISVS